MHFLFFPLIRNFVPLVTELLQLTLSVFVELVGLPDSVEHADQFAKDVRALQFLDVESGVDRRAVEDG